MDGACWLRDHHWHAETCGLVAWHTEAFQETLLYRHAQPGCSWCLDINYFQAQNHNLDMAKASQVPRWREADVFTSLERDGLEYSEAMTNTPPTVTDEMFAHLLAQLGPGRRRRPSHDGAV
jgi:alkylhydroperoxidase family enzyme